jgi:hypothetical protein
MADNHIERIRKLRALAESTTFPAEAEAFRSKADELMKRHGLTDAVVNPRPKFPPPVSPFDFIEEDQGIRIEWAYGSFVSGTSNAASSTGTVRLRFG